MNTHYANLWEKAYSKPHSGRINEIRHALQCFDHNCNVSDKSQKTNNNGLVYAVLVAAGFLLGLMVGMNWCR